MTIRTNSNTRGRLSIKMLLIVMIKYHRRPMNRLIVMRHKLRILKHMFQKRIMIQNGSMINMIRLCKKITIITASRVGRTKLKP
jgi:hypothetical protein